MIWNYFFSVFLGSICKAGGFNQYKERANVWQSWIKSRSYKIRIHKTQYSTNFTKTSTRINDYEPVKFFANKNVERYLKSSSVKLKSPSKYFSVENIHKIKNKKRFDTKYIITFFLNRFSCHKIYGITIQKLFLNWLKLQWYNSVSNNGDIFIYKNLTFIMTT